MRAVQTAPLLAGRLAQLEDHGERRLAAEAALGFGGPQAHRGEGALYGVRRSDVFPVLGRKIVEGQQNVAVLGQAGASPTWPTSCSSAPWPNRPSPIGS